MLTFSSSKSSVEIFKSSHPCRRCFTFMISILSNLRIVSFETKDLIGSKREQIRYGFVKKKSLVTSGRKSRTGITVMTSSSPLVKIPFGRIVIKQLAVWEAHNIMYDGELLCTLRIIKSCWKTFSPWKLIGLFQLQLCLVSPQFCLLSAGLKFVINLVHWNVLVSPWKPSWSEWRGCQQSV